MREGLVLRLDELRDWAEAIPPRSDEFNTLSVVTAAQSGGTWGGPFRAIASDGHDYFVKALSTCPPGSQASLAVEFIVANVGRLVGAPVCSTSLIRIPKPLETYEIKPGVQLGPGLAHASRALDHAEEIRPALNVRSDDDNRTRHVGVYALYDWCFGHDQQWLQDLDADNALWSHDHGLYLPPHSGLLDSTALVAHVDEPHPLPDVADGLNAAAVQEVADSIESVSAEDLTGILGCVPKSWPVDDDALATVGWFLYRRRKAVAERMREMT